MILDFKSDGLGNHEQLREWRQRKNNVMFVTTNGCFDLFHPGHLSLLSFCHEQRLAMSRRPKYANYQIMVVALVNTDRSVSAIKLGRPVQSWNTRATMVDGCKYVDYVLPLHEMNPMKMLQIIHSECHVKDASYEQTQTLMPEYRTVVDNGGHMAFAPRVAGQSTTETLRYILSNYKIDETTMNVVPIDGLNR